MRKKIFLDTNIVIDYLSNRIPFGEDALRIFSLPPQQCQLCISALSFTTIFYVLKKHFNRSELFLQFFPHFLSIFAGMAKIFPKSLAMGRRMYLPSQPKTRFAAS